MQVFFSDRNGALLTLLVPVVLASLLGMLFAPRGKTATLDLLVVDQDGGAAVAAFVDALGANEALRVERADEADARERVSRGDASVALILPAGSSEKLTPAHLFAGDSGHAELLYDPSRKIEASMATGLIQKTQMEQAAKGFTDPTAVRELFSNLRAVAAAGRLGSLGASHGDWLDVIDRSIALLDKKIVEKPAATSDAGDDDGPGGMRPPLTLHARALTAAGPGANYNSYAHTFAGMLCMFLLFLGQDTAKNLLAERRQGTLARLRVSRASHAAILVSLVLSTAALAMLMTAGIYLVGFLVFGIEVLGSWIGFAAILLAQALFVGGFSLLLAGVGRSEKQVTSIGTAAILAMSFLGGAWFPTFLMPEWLRTLAAGVPTHWATEGLAGMTWRGLPLSTGLAAAGVLLAFAAAAAAVGAWRISASDAVT